MRADTSYLRAIGLGMKAKVGVRGAPENVPREGLEVPPSVDHPSTPGTIPALEVSDTLG